MTGIVKLEVSNLMRLRAISIEPDGSTVVITGKNGAGKTSVLNAIWMALGGKRAFPRQPVREGAAEATIRLELEDIIVERTIKPEGTTRLRVSSPDGARYPSPQQLLDGLVGQLSFDPLAFTRMDAKAQRALLQQLVGLDTSELDARRAQLFDERRDVKREVRRLEGELSGVPQHDDAPEDEVSVAELTKELQAAELHGRDVVRAEAVVAGKSDELHGAQERAGNLRELIAQQRAAIATTARIKAEAEAVARLDAEAAEAEVTELEARLTRGEGEVIPQREAALEEAHSTVAQLQASAPDTLDIANRLAGAEALNRKIRSNRRHHTLELKRQATAAAAKQFTASIAEIDSVKRAMIDAAEYPLPGLAVDDLGVLLNGLPLEQASGAEQLRASVAIGFALNPRLRVLLVRDGSLLDESNMQVLADMAEAAGGQVWLERVAGPGEVGIVIEDGMVAGAEPEVDADGVVTDATDG